MKKISLYSNINPLSPNYFLCVENSDQYGSNCYNYEKDILPKSVKKLKELGFECYTVTEDKQIGKKL